MITSTGFYRCCAPGASAPVVVKNQSPIHQLLPQEDERLCCGKDADMFEVKDVGKLLDESVGCLLLADDDQVVDVAEN